MGRGLIVMGAIAGATSVVDPTVAHRGFPVYTAAAAFLYGVARVALEGREYKMENKKFIWGTTRVRKNSRHATMRSRAIEEWISFQVDLRAISEC